MPGRQPVLKGGNRVREKIPPRLVLKQHPFELRHSYLLRLLLSLLQLSNYRLFAGFSPLSTTFLKNLLYNGAIKKGSRLQHSGVFINSFILCSLFRGTDPRRDRASRSSKNASSLDSTERGQCPLTTYSER